MTKLSHADARLLLAKHRQMTSLMDKEIIAEGADMVFDNANYVPLYYDRGYSVVSDCGEITAYRAITLKGQSLWMVFTPSKAHGYHATCTDPVEAIEAARATWAHRRAVRQDWGQVEKTARDLIWGRQRFDVREEDLIASPLCALGIQGFRASIGMSRITKMPGRLAALVMMLEPQMGFVIHAAMQRHAQQADQHSSDNAALAA